MKFEMMPTVARIGYIARAFLFISIGTMTLFATWGAGGREAGFQDAILAVLRGAFGQVVALSLAAGLVCFAVWRFAEAFLPVDNRPQSLIQRAAFAGSGLLYLAMSAWTVTLVFGARAAPVGSDQSAHQWTEWIFRYPFGVASVMAFGVALIIGATVLVIRGFKPNFRHSVALRSGAPALLAALGRFGLVCRAIVFAEVGGFLIYAASSFDFRQAKGMEGAFRAIKQLDHGHLLLAIMASGFIAFGLFDFGKALYRDLNPRKVSADP
jgi:hypothetical protein